MFNEQKFYNALELVFTGAKIEGDSGYINLLKIKGKYYEQVLKQFQDEFNKESFSSKDREWMFERLYDFFQKYFSESGSVYFVNTAAWQRVYEKIYTDDKDVVLFWKTNMLYYVKSDVLFRSMEVNILDEHTNKDILFYFDVKELQNKQNNEKKEVVFTYRGSNDKGCFVFDVSYSEGGRGTQIDTIVKQIKVKEDIVEKAFKTFNKQASVDFFINKNAEKFLRDQLDMFLHQILLDENNQFSTDALNRYKKLKEYAIKIIVFIAQFEDELVKVWNKPKFAHSSNFVITIDKLTNNILNKIQKHKGLIEQIKEWTDLGMVENGFEFKRIFDSTLLGSQIKEPYKYLPLDTKYFKDIELDILALFDNLDEALDGRLIHSENYQALNTLQEKYKEKIQCIYIDPPYNTDSSPIIYINNYKDSSWLTMMDNRFEVSKKLLLPTGINVTAIDDIELRYLTTIQDSIFGNKNYLTTITSKCNPQGRVANKVSKTTEYHILHAKDISAIDKIFVKKNGLKRLTSLKRTGTNSRREERPNRYYPILIKNNNIEMIEDEEYKKIYNSSDRKFDDVYLESLKKKYEKLGFTFILPLGKNNEKLIWQRTFNRVKKEKNTYIIEENSIKTPAFDIEIPKTLWDDLLFSNPEYGSEYLKNILGHNDFETPKSYYIIKQFLTMFDNNGIYLDYFSGSGTTAEAVIRFNNEDEGERKYILIELGNHFNTVIIPRIKKVCFSDKWKDGKAQEGKGISQFFKYYSLEQYETTLSKMSYQDIKEGTTIWTEPKKYFENYIFRTDKKLSTVIEISQKENDFNFNFDMLLLNIDFPETISNILGLPIRKITDKEVILIQDGIDRTVRYDYKNMNNKEKLEFLKVIKPLIWWSKE
ncbi:MAG: site-specific DNA-methyltransferase [Limnohabitans sp.]|nr:site-specific DNA-methyltransferase [Limnohabitans sp.]